MAVFRQVYFDGTLAAAKRLRKKPSRILDLGAYTGLSTRWFCDEFPEAFVLGVEPHPEHFRLAITNAPEARLVRTAVGGREGRIGIYERAAGEWAAHTREGEGGEPTHMADVAPISSIVEGREFELVKIDIEGAEKAVFESDDLDWLDSVELLFIETHDRFVPGCTEALFGALRRKGIGWRNLERRGSSADFALRLKR